MNDYRPGWLALAAEIRAARLKRGLTQRELAAACGLQGARISQVENATKGTPAATVRQLRRVLGL